MLKNRLEAEFEQIDLLNLGNVDAQKAVWVGEKASNKARFEKYRCSEADSGRGKSI